jgi:hypothetical protein
MIKTRHLMEVFMYKWCPYINMFCADMDDEDKLHVQDIYPYCDGNCRCCPDVEYVK